MPPFLQRALHNDPPRRLTYRSPKASDQEFNDTEFSMHGIFGSIYKILFRNNCDADCSLRRLSKGSLVFNALFEKTKSSKSRVRKIAPFGRDSAVDCAE